MSRSNKFVWVNVALGTALAANSLMAEQVLAIVTIAGTETSGNVEFTWSGQINTVGLGTPESANLSSGNIFAFPGTPGIGSGKNGSNKYNSVFSTSPTFGFSAFNFGETATSDDFGIFSGDLFLNAGYASNDPILGGGTFTGETFASLGINASQSYTYDLINGEQIFLEFGQPIPEPLTMLGASAAVAFGAAFKRKQKNQG